jgi:hypothetical protein
MRDHGVDTALDGFIKSSLLAGVDADVNVFKDHGGSGLMWMEAGV